MFAVFLSRYYPRTYPRKMSSLAVVGLLAIGMSGCAKRQQDVTGSVQMEPDYRERHPIVLANTPKTLEIYATRGPKGLDYRQDQDLRAYAAEYKSSGRGAISISVPRGGSSHAAGGSLSGVRNSLASAGISSQYLHITSYTSQDPYSAAPIRLSFLKLQAKVDSMCGQWHTDISGAGTSERFKNQSPPNFGCAYQSAIAAQVAYPLDLARPRQEGPVDVQKRIENIKSLRTGKDPSTSWTTTAQSTKSQ